MLKFLLQVDDYDYYYDSGGLPAWFWIITGILVVVQYAAMWRVYTKAGREGWEAIIPIYNYYVMLKIVGKPGWWLILMLIPIVNIVILVWVYNLLSKSFGKDEGFTLGLIFLGIIFWPILAWGNAKYIGAQSKEAIAERQRQQGFDFESKP
jgi:hypothetical protein